MNRKKRKALFSAIVLGIVIIVGILSRQNLLPESVSEKAEKVTEIVFDKSNKVVNDVISRIYKEKNTIEFEKSVPILPVQTKNGLELPELKPGYQFFEHVGYCGQYDKNNHVALWVAYELTKDELDNVKTSRSDEFYDNPNIVGCAKISDYKNNGKSIDRGHLANSRDFLWSEEANVGTFSFENVAAQYHRFNSKLFLKAEDAVRDAARKYGSVYVITGPVLTDGPFETIGNGVVIPHYFFKAILAVDENGTAHAIAMILPQEYSNGNLSPYFVSVDQLEEVVGFDLFCNLDLAIQKVVESQYSLSDWPASFK